MDSIKVFVGFLVIILAILLVSLLFPQIGWGAAADTGPGDIAGAIADDIPGSAPVMARVEAVEPVRSPAVTIDLTGVVLAIISTLASIVTAKILPGIRQWIANKTTAQQQDILRSIIRTLVYAAEQMYSSVRANGVKKLAFV